MMRVENDLPKELADYYENEPIHKAVKPSTSLIIVHTKSHRRDQWRRHGKTWELQPVAPGGLVRPKLGQPRAELWGVEIPVASSDIRHDQPNPHRAQ